MATDRLMTMGFWPPAAVTANAVSFQCKTSLSARAGATVSDTAASVETPSAVIVLASRMEWPPFAPLRRAPDGVVIARHRQGACQAVG